MENFCTFKKFIQKQDDYYNEIIDNKHIAQKFYKLKYSDEEFILMFYINALINDKIPAHQIIKKIPKKYIKLFKECLRSRLKPEKLAVEWSPVHIALKEALKHNKKVNDFDYYETYYPCRWKRV
jgi:hypothetical protein